MPANCALQSTSRYAVKHNPAAYYVGADDRTACERDDVPMTEFVTDLDGNFPEFSMVTPDICNDMHDCPVATGEPSKSAAPMRTTTRCGSAAPSSAAFHVSVA